MHTYKTILVDDAFFSRKARRFGDDDIIIAFMGPTGSGKSQIIDTLTGQQGQRAKDSLKSVTKDLEASRILDHDRYGSRIVLIDTPGFDDSSRSDEQILKLIGEWLKKTYQKRVLLSGIVYVHRITDQRMAATPHRNLLMFAELTGPGSAKNVVLATTMWDKLNPKFDDGNKREKGLKEEYWNTMIFYGAAVERFLNDSDSAWSIIDNIVDRNKEEQKAVLLFQEERVDRKKSLKETSAGQALYQDLNRLVERQNKAMQESTGWRNNSGNGTRGSQESETERALRPSTSPPLLVHGAQSKPVKVQNHADIDSNIPKDNPKTVSSIFSSSRFMSLGNKEKQSMGQHQRDTRITVEELKEEDVVIAVIGLTGSGKSTFINVATGLDVGVGHDLISCTSEVGAIKMSFPGYNIFFVDTPGFNHTYKSDDDILKMISNWLETTFERRTLLSGLLYLHRITDNRTAGTPINNLRMFEELCGRNTFNNVILATTMWDEIDKEVGEFREGELESRYWKAMLDRHSSIGRFLGTRDSAFRLIAPLLEEANIRNALLLQKELVDLDLMLREARAGHKLRSEIEQLGKQFWLLLQRMREEYKRPNNATSLQSLMEEYDELKKTSAPLLKHLADLQIPLGRQFMNITNITFDINGTREKHAPPAEGATPGTQ